MSADLDDLRHLLRGEFDRVYELGSVPASPAYPYLVVSLATVTPDARTLDGSGTRPRRFVVQGFARTHDAIAAVGSALLDLLDASFPLGHDRPQMRVEVVSPLMRDPDDLGVLGITHTYRI